MEHLQVRILSADDQQVARRARGSDRVGELKSKAECLLQAVPGVADVVSHERLEGGGVGADVMLCDGAPLAEVREAIRRQLLIMTPQGELLN